MKLPIRDQILWPLMGLLLLAILANVIFSAWWMSTRSAKALDSRQRQIIGVLEESSFPLLPTVLEKLHLLTGDELLVWDSHLKKVVAGTLPTDVHPLKDDRWIEEENISRPDTLRRWTINGKEYVVRACAIRGSPAQTLFLLTSDESRRRATMEALWPPLAVGAGTLLLTIPLTLLIAWNWAGRVRSIEQHVKSIALGQFGLERPKGVIDDELSRLVESINSMSRQLDSMRQELIRGERTRLVAQLTAGFAHQLRNGLAGAKLAIQLHESRCTSSVDNSLVVARQQLALTEEEVRSLLSLGKGTGRQLGPVDLGEIALVVRNLVTPSCDHKNVRMTLTLPPEIPLIQGFAEGLRAAILNLTLNAIEAAGPGGNVWLTVQPQPESMMLFIDDDGPGPPAEVADSLFDLFVTTKQEGIGLGLAVASTVARDHQGSLSWQRLGERTRFELRLPFQPAIEENHPA
ncbi:PAS domain-containing sensor histidine kinase [Schlesneria sp. DSM 10557]|uniref:sensor histidine kinase n=1 Tax=Schlesneria sp. DSM 10557 TaxID=3044399 RepID=UPI0035A0C419